MFFRALRRAVATLTRERGAHGLAARDHIH
jgi:hypothetical protein